jgi:hypothetical protein
MRRPRNIPALDLGSFNVVTFGQSLHWTDRERVAETVYDILDIEGVLSNYFSTSFAAPHLFGDRLEAFAHDVRAELTRHSPTGLFRDWPGVTEILIATKPG